MIAFAMSQKGVTINGQVFVLDSADTAFPQLVAALFAGGYKGYGSMWHFSGPHEFAGITVQFLGNAFYDRFLQAFQTRNSGKETGPYWSDRYRVIVIWDPVDTSHEKHWRCSLYLSAGRQSVLAPGIAAASLWDHMETRQCKRRHVGIDHRICNSLTRLGAKVFYTSVENCKSFRTFL
jgi:hypothetical protein